MAWGSKKTFRMLNTDGTDDTSSHTVKAQPINQAYPTGAITLAQKSTDQSVWGLTSDSLADNMHYRIYVDDVATDDVWFSPRSIPPLG